MSALHASIERALTRWASDQLTGDDPRGADIFQLVTNRADLMADAVVAALPAIDIKISVQGDAAAVHRLLVTQAARAAVRLGCCPPWRLVQRARFRWTVAMLAQAAREIEIGGHLSAQAGVISEMEEPNAAASPAAFTAGGQ